MHSPGQMPAFHPRGWPGRAMNLSYALRLSLGLLSQYIAREPGLDVRDVAVNLVEPVSAPGRDDHHVSRLEFDRLPSLDPRVRFFGSGMDPPVV